MSKYNPYQLEIEKKPQVVQQNEDIFLRNDNVLYLPTKKIEKSQFNSQALIKLISIMHNVMIKKNGIGIAANQVGKSLQIFLIEVVADENPRYKDTKSDAIPLQVFINPKITRASKNCINFWHGCLSAVGCDLGNVATYEWIEYEAFDVRGKKKTGRLDNLAAVIFQHELRHLLGGTYLDKAENFVSVKDANDKDNTNFNPANENIPHLIGDYKIGESIDKYFQSKA